jgi:5S rRNA maturation endonuclease (ribonuclease M5)
MDFVKLVINFILLFFQAARPKKFVSGIIGRSRGAKMRNYNYKELREIDLNLVTQNLLNGIEKDTKESYQTRKYILPSNNNIAITGLKWFDNTNSVGGIGAIDLLMYTKRISLIDSAEILSNFFGNRLDKKICKGNYRYESLIPERCDMTWLSVKRYLINIRCIPENIIDSLYNNSLVWSDENNNCVFPRDLNSGAYLRGILPGIHYKRTIGIDGWTYIIPGDNIIIITEAPIDGISLKYYYQNSTIVSTGGRIGFNKIAPYLKNNKKVLLAHDNDKSGDAQADKLMELINKNVERLRPLYKLKDWNEVLKYDIKKYICNK